MKNKANYSYSISNFRSILPMLNLSKIRFYSTSNNDEIGKTTTQRLQQELKKFTEPQLLREQVFLMFSNQINEKFDRIFLMLEQLIKNQNKIGTGTDKKAPKNNKNKKQK